MLCKFLMPFDALSVLCSLFQLDIRDSPHLVHQWQPHASMRAYTRRLGLIQASGVRVEQPQSEETRYL